MDITELINISDYEREARARIPESFFGYYAGGACDEITLRDNVTAYSRIKLRPRVLVDVSNRLFDTTIMGCPTAAPIIIAPTAMAKLAHPDGEVAIAWAAKNTGIIQCLSTLSTCSIEEVAAVETAKWFQLYVYKDRQITEGLVERAAAAGFRALVLTVDLPVLGVRENIMRTGLQLPPGVTMKNFEGLHNTEAAAIQSYINEQIDPSLSWDDMKWLISITKLPVWVKGILRGDDARRALDCGVAGVIVSNHGGRQLDTAITGIEALPEVVAAVGSHVEVLVDGGVRRGTDVLKALALGARAVLVGRPVLWGLAVAGQEGVEQVLDILKREIDNAMALCGCPSLADIGPDLIAN